MDLEQGWCGGCGRDVDFERPACVDHDDDCPELICCACGAAYIGFQIGCADPAPSEQQAVPVPRAA